MSDGTTHNPYFVTLGEAAKQTGFSKSKLSRDIRDGKLSVREKSSDTGTFKIDPAELTRYADAQRVLRATVAQGVEEQRVTPYSATETPPATGVEPLAMLEERHRRELVEERLASAKAQLEQMAAQRDELRVERDAWKAQAERALLTFQGVQQAAAAVPAPEATPARFWDFWGLFRRAG